MGTELLWPSVCAMAGLALIILEVFIPSGGLIGLLSAGLMLLSLWLAFSVSVGTGLVFLLGLSVGLPLVLSLAVRLWPHTPIGRWMFLKPPSLDEVESAPPQSSGGTRFEHLVGQHARTITPLRPSGVIEHDGRRIDAMSEDGFLDAQILVKVIQVRAGQAIVRVATESFGLDDVLDEPIGGT